MQRELAAACLWASASDTDTDTDSDSETSPNVAAGVFGMVGGVPQSCVDLADQARRAMASVPLNLAEGAGRAGRDRVYHFRIAYGSVKEGDPDQIQRRAGISGRSQSDPIVIPSRCPSSSSPFCDVQCHRS